MKRRKVEFSSHTANLALLRQCVRDFLNGYPFSEKQRLLIVLGVDEACTNVIRYAYRLRDDQLISLRMEGLRKCVRMRLRDYGEQVLPHQMKGRSYDIMKPGGRAGSSDWLHVWTIRDGRISGLRSLNDTALLAEAWRG